MPKDPGRDFREMSQFEMGQQAYPRRFNYHVDESEAMHALLLRDPELIRAIVARQPCLRPDETIELEELEDPEKDNDIPCVMESMARSGREIEKIVRHEHRSGETIAGKIVNLDGEERGSIGLQFRLDSYAGIVAQATRLACELFETSRPSEDERPTRAQESSRVMVTINR